MALSYFGESEAPRDFRISSTESEAHYTKCLLCYTVKRNFYCPDCIKAGNFVNSSMPYSDRYADKQAKLIRLKTNRKHVLDRCEKLLAPKLKRDTLLTQAKQARDKIDLIRLAIEQRKNNIEEKRKVLTELKQYNNELSLKLPRYQKRVSSLGKHAQLQRIELQKKMSLFNDQAQALAALRRSRIRQLTKYIFPVYVTYDCSDSIEDMEFIGEDIEEEPRKNSQFHIVAPWVSADGDFSSDSTLSESESSSVECSGVSGSARGAAAVALAAQLTALIAHVLDVRLPYPISLAEYWQGRSSGEAAQCRLWLASLCAGAAWARAGAPPAPTAPLHALQDIATAAAADDPLLGRVGGTWSECGVRAWEGWAGALGRRLGPAGTAHDTPHDDMEPEHLHWPDNTELEELSSTPPMGGPAQSLVTSAAASLVSMWRGWTK